MSERIAQHRVALQEAEARQIGAQARLEQAQQRLAQVEDERQTWSQEVARLEAMYRLRNRPERPHSSLAQARRKLAVRERRLAHQRRDLERAQRWLERCQQKVADLEAELEELEQRLARFIEDNRTNPWPIRAIFRLDGGFASGHNVTLLIEMG